MKKYLVIGNPIEHSLSPKVHNYWIKNNNIKRFMKKKLNNVQLENLVLDIRNEKISGINVTVPFKKSILPYIDVLSDEASKTQSVNTVYLNKNKIVGHNTDIIGFTMSVENIKFNIEEKILILGAGVVSSTNLCSYKNESI